MTPKGITIHYTADRDIDRVINSLSKNNLAYHIIIDRDGSIVQMAYFTQRVYHAGKARWISRSPNREHISVALASWGKLSEKGETWVGEKLPDDDIIERPGNLTKLVFKWDKATGQQEAALFTFLEWACKQFEINPHEICGHDECAIPEGRKEDPGGVISVSCSEIRQLISRRLFGSATA